MPNDGVSRCRHWTPSRERTESAASQICCTSGATSFVRLFLQRTPFRGTECYFRPLFPISCRRDIGRPGPPAAACSTSRRQSPAINKAPGSATRGLEQIRQPKRMRFGTADTLERVGVPSEQCSLGRTSEFVHPPSPPNTNAARGGVLIWRWTQSSANPSPTQIPCNRKKYREFHTFLRFKSTRGVPRALHRRLRSRRLPSACPLAANLWSVPARKSCDKGEDQPVAAKNRRLPRTTESAILRLA